MEAVEHNGQEFEPVIATRAENLPKIQINFQKSPEPTSSILKIEEGVAVPIQNIEEEVEAISNLSNLKPKKLDVEIRNNNPIQNFREWLQYPASTDKIRISNSVYTPAVISVYTGLAGIAASGSFLMSDAIITNSALIEIAGSTFFGSAALTGVGLAVEKFSKFLINKIEKTEEKNRVNFGELVKVSRAYLTKFSPLYQVMKEYPTVKETGLIGELHFGTNYEKYWNENSNTVAVRDILAGLVELAEACENNDSRLTGIQNFGTITDIMTQQYFEEFGFIIRESEVSNLKRTNNFLNKFLSIFHDQNKDKYPGESLSRTGMKTVTITRDDLIKNKLLLSEKMNIINRRLINTHIQAKK